MFNKEFINLFLFELVLILLMSMSAASRNLVLLFLTTIMEVVLVCFLLSTLQRLPYKLESKRRQSLPLSHFLVLYIHIYMYMCVCVSLSETL